MDYKIEPSETNFGKGVKIEGRGGSYEQFNCNDGLIARVYQESQDCRNKSINKDYQGIIFKTHFQDVNQDYAQFKILSERLQQLSGEEILNSKERFMDYICHSGLEQELSEIDASIRINLVDKGLPEVALSWLKSKSHLGALVSDIGLYAGGALLMGNILSDVEFTEKFIGYLAYGFLTPAVEFMLGGIGGRFGDAEWVWCGPLHALSFVPLWINYKNKLRQPDYILNKFIKDHKKLGSIKLTGRYQKKYAKQNKRIDLSFDILRDMFPFTKYQKGFSITYHSPDRDDVISFFDYILDGGNPLQVSYPTNKIKKVQEKPLETKLITTKFTNPWEVKIPKLYGK